MTNNYLNKSQHIYTVHFIKFSLTINIYKYIINVLVIIYKITTGHNTDNSQFKALRVSPGTDYEGTRESIQERIHKSLHGSPCGTQVRAQSSYMYFFENYHKL